MKNLLKSHIPLLSLGLILMGIVIFWALTTGQCLEITSKQIEIKASCHLDKEEKTK